MGLGDRARGGHGGGEGLIASVVSRMTRPAPFRTLLALALIIGALIVRSLSTPTPLPESAPAADFSSARALRHVSALAERPHPPGSADHARVREYILAEIRALGLEPQVQEATAVGTRYPAAGHVKNVLARLPGRARGGKAVLIAAHYDGVGAAPAASDDGAGSAALLETLRALRAGEPLEHDVIALFTDGEESGLLGAAAFVREHPWAGDVALTMNFEARGTAGRSMMFETGAGNLDVARVLAGLDDVTASSLSVTVYRSLPNDTDLSELSLLGTPALNFAFVDGVERYHTFHDDLAHLDAGSLQHHGTQMLALARAFGDGPLPRPVTGDAIFFDAPLVGVVGYPESWGVPLALLVAAIVIALLVLTARRETKWGRGLALGALGMLVAAGLGGFATSKLGAAVERLHTAMTWDGGPSWSGVYALALALLALAVAAGAWALMRRWSGREALHVGALVVWVALTIVTAVRLPGASFLFAWPVLAVAVAGLVEARLGEGTAALVARWVATAVAASFLIPVIHTTGGYTLPLAGVGGAAVGALVPMLAWLLAPQLESLGGEHRSRSAAVIMAASLALLVTGAATVRRDSAHPTTENLAYVTTVDSDTAWLAAPATALRDGSFAEAALGNSARVVRAADADSIMRWIHSAAGTTQGLAVRGVARTITDGPAVEIVADSIVADSVMGVRRRLTLRFTAPAGTLAYRVNGAAFVRAVAIDGRVLDGARYRRVPAALSIPFTAPPDSGFIAVIDSPVDSAVTLRLAAITAGLPAMDAFKVPARPAGIVAMQNGDVTVRYRRVELRSAARPRDD